MSNIRCTTCGGELDTAKTCHAPGCTNLSDPRWYVRLPACDAHGEIWPDEIAKLHTTISEWKAASALHAENYVREAEQHNATRTDLHAKLKIAEEFKSLLYQLVAVMGRERDALKSTLNARGMSCTPDLDMMRLTNEKEAIVSRCRSAEIENVHLREELKDAENNLNSTHALMAVKQE